MRARSSLLETARWLLFTQFERVLVVGLVICLLAIHWLVDAKLAFLNLYYLPVMVAGFLVGRHVAVWSAVLVVNLVVFYQLVHGLEGPPGLDASVALTLVPWAGFLILTGYVVGALAEERQASLGDVQQAYVALLELLTFSLEGDQPVQRGHGHRVAQLAVRLGRELGLDPATVENLRVGALLQEIGPQHPRLLALLAQFPGGLRSLPVARTLRGASALVAEYARYQQLVGDEWPVDQLPLSIGVKVLAVADAYENLQLPSPLRPALSPEAALTELEGGAGRLYASEVVHALRRLARAPAATAPRIRSELFGPGRN